MYKKRDGEIGEEARRLVATWKHLVQKENPRSTKERKHDRQLDERKKLVEKIVSPKIKQEPTKVKVKIEPITSPSKSDYHYERAGSFSMLTDHLNNMKEDLMKDIQREAESISETIKQE